MWTWSAFPRQHSIVPCPITIIFTMPVPPCHMLRASLFSHIFGSTRISPVCYREKEQKWKSHRSYQTVQVCSESSKQRTGTMLKIPIIRSEILIPVKNKTSSFRLRYLSCGCKRSENTYSFFRAGLSSLNMEALFFSKQKCIPKYHLPEEGRSEHLSLNEK
jgi:hypothetical protein